MNDKPRILTQQSKEHIATIDLLRAFAILLVVLFHSQDFLFPGHMLQREGWIGIAWDGSWERILLTFSPSAYGWSGVDLFLLISGFLIHGNTIAKPGPPQWSSFFSKRFFRIYPPYLLTLLFFGLLTGPYEASQWWWHLTMLFNLKETTFFSINPSFWSLALEMQLYAVYPLVYWCRQRFGMDRTVVIIALLSVATMFWVVGAGPFGPEVRMSLPRLWVIWALGALIAERHREGRTVFRKHGRWIILLLLLLPVVQFSVLREYLFRFQVMFIHALFLEWTLVRTERYTTLSSSAPRSTFRSLLVGVGLTSYSLYLLHQPIMHMVYPLLPFSQPLWGAVLKVAVLVPMLILLSYLMYRYVELPSIRLGGSLRARHSRSLNSTTGV